MLDFLLLLGNLSFLLLQISCHLPTTSPFQPPGKISYFLVLATASAPSRILLSACQPLRPPVCTPASLLTPGLTPGEGSYTRVVDGVTLTIEKTVICFCVCFWALNLFLQRKHNRIIWPKDMDPADRFSLSGFSLSRRLCWTT